jgi:hypothetical protein
MSLLGSGLLAAETLRGSMEPHRLVGMGIGEVPGYIALAILFVLVPFAILFLAFYIGDRGLRFLRSTFEQGHRPPADDHRLLETVSAKEKIGLARSARSGDVITDENYARKVAAACRVAYTGVARRVWRNIAVLTLLLLLISRDFLRDPSATDALWYRLPLVAVLVGALIWMGPRDKRRLEETAAVNGWALPGKGTSAS